MSLKTILSILLTCLSTFAIGNAEKDLSIWEHAYFRQFSIATDLALGKLNENFESSLLSQFAIVYLFYKIGNEEDVFSMLDSIDKYIEDNLIYH